MARPAVYINDDSLVVALRRAAERINEGRTKKLEWNDIVRACLAHVMGTEDPTPGGLDLDRIRDALDLPPFIVGERPKKARRGAK
jgi:hypothetical protein